MRQAADEVEPLSGLYVPGWQSPYSMDAVSDQVPGGSSRHALEVVAPWLIDVVPATHGVGVHEPAGQ
ncbi:MAG TPA: hypothetical protein VHX66_08365 [Solirubrobacteraceae bacterium]|nr:hypothetical protein [Solirubrobacteraceae bacterium]